MEHPGDLLERLEHRPIDRTALVFVTATPGDRCTARARLRRNGGRQARLADPGLADQGRDATGAGPRGIELGHEQPLFDVAADEASPLRRVTAGVSARVATGAHGAARPRSCGAFVSSRRRRNG